MDQENHTKPTGTMNPFYRFARAVAVFFVRPWFRLRIEGMENIPESGPFILASNHKTVLDPIFIAAGMKHLQLWAMAKKELFKIPILGVIIKGVGAYPVDRGSGATDAMDAAKDIIDRGCVMFIFPEGHRSKTQELLPAKSGIGLVCAETGAPVLPVSVYFEGKIHLWSKVVVRFGDMLPSTSFAFSTPLKSKERKEASRLIMERIAELYWKGLE